MFCPDFSIIRATGGPVLIPKAWLPNVPLVVAIITCRAISS
jgi:hypothetical protein